MKQIELSLGKNYVCNWGLWEAVREIMQNAQDSEKDGHPLSITYENEDLPEGGTLTITNDDVRLNISSLILGNSTKTDDVSMIGKYGEGYKLALLVLLRLGKTITIYTGSEKWKPKFRKSKTFETDVLTIEREPYEGAVDRERVMFIIDGITITEFEMLKLKSIRIRQETNRYHKIKMVDCDYGKILLDDEYKGKFYVEGLFIQNDENFKYGYSFNSEDVNLDRDRKAINYYELCELTTKSLLSQTEDFKIVETSITSKTHDTSDLQYYYKNASDEFKEGFAKDYVERHEIDSDTFVGTEKEVIVSGKDKVKVVDEITARWVNDGLGKEDEYQEIRRKVEDKDNEEVAMKYYNNSVLPKLYDWAIHNRKRISKTQLINLFNLLDEVPVDGIRYIRYDVKLRMAEECGLSKDDLQMN